MPINPKLIQEVAETEKAEVNKETRFVKFACNGANRKTPDFAISLISIISTENVLKDCASFLKG